VRDSVDEDICATYLPNGCMRKPSLTLGILERSEICNEDASSPQLESKSKSVQIDVFLTISELLCNQFSTLECLAKLAERNQLTVERLMDELNHINNEALKKFSSINVLHASFCELRSLCIKLGCILNNVADEVGKEFEGNKTEDCPATVMKTSYEICIKREELQTENSSKPSIQTAMQHANSADLSPHEETKADSVFENGAVRHLRESSSNVPSSQSGDDPDFAQMTNDSLDIDPESAEMEQHALAAFTAGTFQWNNEAKRREVISLGLMEHSSVSGKISLQNEKLQQTVSACSSSCMLQLAQCKQRVLQMESKTMPLLEDGFHVENQTTSPDSAMLITDQRVARYKFSLSSVVGLQASCSSSQSEKEALLDQLIGDSRSNSNRATTCALSYCS
jgi:predicted DNA-binding ribbon-helix-helix protein